MVRKFSVLLVFVALLVAIVPAFAQGGVQIPEVVEGKTNVAVVLIGPINDGGWSQAHYDGAVYMKENLENANVVYLENVEEGTNSEQVFRSLAQKGFDVIFGTSFGFMDAMEAVAEEFEDTYFIHVSGYKSNGTNFGNLMGAMEHMKYLAGYLSGQRAAMDGENILGYMYTFPIPEELRLGNAFMLGAKKTCPECTMIVTPINSWHDPIAEKEAAKALFDKGAYVVFTGADTPAPADMAKDYTDGNGKWGIPYDWSGSCVSERCLTLPYWNWGPIYASIVEGIVEGTYVPGRHYFDGDARGLGLVGFMEGEELPKGLQDMPEEALEYVRNYIADLEAGKIDRFDLFAGPIVDNKGNTVIAEGEKMEDSDLDTFDCSEMGCKYGMHWWADGIQAELP